MYPYELAGPHHTWVEIHMNTYPKGSQDTSYGTYPNNHQFHLTAEITHGFTENFEFAGYIVTAFVPDVGPRFAGVRFRPRFRIPETWHWPFRLSISTEVDFTKHQFDPNTISIELRPILDKKIGNLYLAVNPTLTKSLRGPDSGQTLEFEPSGKISYNLTKLIAAGLEYYAGTGPITGFDSLHDQRHMIFPTLDLDISPTWEFNFGVGRGLTAGSEQWTVKWIIGHRFGI